MLTKVESVTETSVCCHGCSDLLSLVFSNVSFQLSLESCNKAHCGMKNQKLTISLTTM